MKYVYILQVVIETENEVRMEIDSVYTTSEKAHVVGKNLIVSDNQVIHYNVSRYMVFQ
jgi:hypothetical protein